MKGRIILIGRSTESRSRSSSNIINKIINSSSKDLRLSYTTITTCPEGKVDWWAKIRQKSQEYSSTISLQKLVNFYRNTNNNTFLLSATFLQKNLPIRVAQQYERANRFPLGLCTTPSVMKIRSNYLKMFKEISEFPEVSNHDEEERFSKILQHFHVQNNSILFLLAKGISELRNINVEHYNNTLGQYPEHFFYGPDDIDFATERNFQKQIEYFLLSRIGISLLVSQHLEMRRQFYEQPDTARKASNYIGLINTKTNVYKVALEAIESATYVCNRDHMRSPKVKVHLNLNGRSISVDQAKDVEISFCYFPSHVYFVLFEIIKNSMAATVDFHRDSASLPPINIHIAGGEDNEDFTVRISDEGGGIPRSLLKKIFAYSYSTKRIDFSLYEDLNDFATTSPMSGMGVGLTISRLICRYLGGELILVPMEGKGTDAFIYLYRLKDKLEPNIPLPMGSWS